MSHEVITTEAKAKQGQPDQAATPSPALIIGGGGGGGRLDKHMLNDTHFEIQVYRCNPGLSGIRLSYFCQAPHRTELDSQGVATPSQSSHICLHFIDTVKSDFRLTLRFTDSSRKRQK